MMNLAMPAMSTNRINALIRALKVSNVYLEFGMGGSTVLAAQLGVPNFYAIDSSLQWVRDMTLQLSTIQTTSNIKLLHVDLGPTGDWGYPIDKKNIENWPNYYSGIWNLVLEAGLQPDLVLIDGRFRVPCFLYSLLHMRIGSVIVFDDYLNRPEYHLVERFVHPVAYHDEMAIFEITGNENMSKIANSLFANLYSID